MNSSRFVKRIGVLLLIVSCILLGNSGSAQEKGKIRVAVMDFTKTTQAPELQNLEQIVPEWLTLFLVETGTFDVIERRNLETVIKEQSLGQTGIIDATSAAQLGKVLGVNILVTGTLIKFEKTIEITAKLIDTTNGAIVGVASATTSDKSEVRSKVKELATSISQKLGGHEGQQEAIKLVETFDGDTFDADRWEFGFDEQMAQSDKDNTKWVQEHGILKVTGKYRAKVDEYRMAWLAPNSDIQYHSIEAKIRVREVKGVTGVDVGMDWNDTRWAGISLQMEKDVGDVVAAIEDPKWTEFPSDVEAQIDQWYVMRFEYKDGQFYYYWNDQLIKTLTPATPVGSSEASLSVGFALEETQAMTIEIDEITLR
jgi:TolB-like protein